MKVNSSHPMFLEICKALSNPRRVRILQLCRDIEMSVGSIASILGITPSSVSQNIQILFDCGLINIRQELQRQKFIKTVNKSIELIIDDSSSSTMHR